MYNDSPKLREHESRASQHFVLRGAGLTVSVVYFPDRTHGDIDTPGRGSMIESIAIRSSRWPDTWALENSKRVNDCARRDGEMYLFDERPHILPRVEGEERVSALTICPRRPDGWSEVESKP